MMTDRVPSVAAEWQLRSYVTSQLKHLADDKQRAEALASAAAHRAHFAERKWKPVLAALETAAKEDVLRSVEGCNISSTRSSAATVSSGESIMARAAVVLRILRPQLNISAPTQRKLREIAADRKEREAMAGSWAEMPKGQLTPLSSPTSGDNAFAGGGYWDNRPSPSVPLTPETPLRGSIEEHELIVPHDPTMRAIYDDLLAQVDSAARRIALGRLGMTPSLSDAENFPSLLVKPRHELRAAEFVLERCREAISSSIDPELPMKMRLLAQEDARTTLLYSVRNSTQFNDIDEWLKIDEETLCTRSIYDEQHDALQIHTRRRNSYLEVDETAVRLAWAVRILEDKERAVEAADEDLDSETSLEDEGYDYGNFLRSIKEEASIMPASAKTIVAAKENKYEDKEEEARRQYAQRSGDGFGVSLMDVITHEAERRTGRGLALSVKRSRSPEKGMSRRARQSSSPKKMFGPLLRKSASTDDITSRKSWKPGRSRGPSQSNRVLGRTLEEPTVSMGLAHSGARANSSASLDHRDERAVGLGLLIPQVMSLHDTTQDAREVGQQATGQSMQPILRQTKRERDQSRQSSRCVTHSALSQVSPQDRDSRRHPAIADLRAWADELKCADDDGSDRSEIKILPEHCIEMTMLSKSLESLFANPILSGEPSDSLSDTASVDTAIFKSPGPPPSSPPVAISPKSQVPPPGETLPCSPSTSTGSTMTSRIPVPISPSSLYRTAHRISPFKRPASSAIPPVPQIHKSSTSVQSQHSILPPIRYKMPVRPPPPPPVVPSSPSFAPESLSVQQIIDNENKSESEVAQTNNQASDAHLPWSDDLMARVQAVGRRMAALSQGEGDRMESSDPEWLEKRYMISRSGIIKSRGNSRTEDNMVE